MKTNRLSCLTLVISTLSLALGGGCASSREVRVDAMARPSSTGRVPQSYTLRTNSRAGEPESLRDREAARHVKTALSAQGMWESPDAEKADLIVEIDYGIDPPRVRYEKVQVPVFVRVRSDEAALQRAVGRGRDSIGPDPIPSLPAQRRFVGYEEIPMPVTIREKHLTVSARENGPVVEGRAPPELFRVSASIEDESSDLRGSLPLLASAVMDQLGRPTEGSALAKVRETDEAVDFIKRGL